MNLLLKNLTELRLLGITMFVLLFFFGLDQLTWGIAVGITLY